MTHLISRAALVLACSAIAGCQKHNAHIDAESIAEPALAETILQDEAAKNDAGKTNEQTVTAQRPILPFFGGDDRPLQPTAKETAASALARIGADSVPALIAALDDRDNETREGAAHALALIGPKAAEAVPALIHHLVDSDENVRVVSARALGQIGPIAKDAIPGLIALLKGAPDEPAHPAAPQTNTPPATKMPEHRTSTGHTRRVYETPLPTPPTN